MTTDSDRISRLERIVENHASHGDRISRLEGMIENHATHGDRIGRLEGAYEHLSTKADLQAMETRLLTRIIGVVAIATAIIVAAVRIIAG